ncbi:12170_t:CDS:2, partial [Dentiscutata heterogama]
SPETIPFSLSMDKENKKKIYEYIHNNSVTPTPQPKEQLPKRPVQIPKKFPKQQQQPPPNLSLQKSSTNGEQEIDKRPVAKMTYEQEQAERRRLLEENARPTTIITRSKSKEVSKPGPTSKVDNNNSKVQIPKPPERKNIYQTPVRNSEKSQSHVKEIMPSAEVPPTIPKHNVVFLDSAKKIQYTPKNQKLLPRRTSFTGKEETPISFSTIHSFGKAQRVLPSSKTLADVRTDDHIPLEEQLTPTKSPLPELLTSRRRSKIFQSPVGNVPGKARRVKVSILKEADKDNSDATPTMPLEFITPTQSPLRMSTPTQSPLRTSTPTQSPLRTSISRRRSRIYSSPSLNISGKPKRVKIIESIEGLGDEGKVKNDDLDFANTNAINLTPLNPRKRLSIFPSPSVEVSETSQQFVKMITNKDLNDDRDMV